MVVLLLAKPAAAAPPRHSLGGALDLGVHVARDDALVPLAHTGPRLALSPRYFVDLGRGIAVADARVGLAYVRGAEGEEGLTTVWGLHAALLFFVSQQGRLASVGDDPNRSNGYGSVGGSGADCAVALGPTIGWDNETLFFGDWDDAHAYWLGTLWIGPRVYGLWRLSEAWRADLDARMSLAGYFARPPAYRYNKQETSHSLLAFMEWPTHGLEPGWLADFQVVRASLDFYHTRMRARVPVGLGLGAETGFSHASSPDHVVSFEAVGRVSYAWGL